MSVETARADELVEMFGKTRAEAIALGAIRTATKEARYQDANFWAAVCLFVIDGGR